MIVKAMVIAHPTPNIFKVMTGGESKEFGFRLTAKEYGAEFARLRGCFCDIQEGSYLELELHKGRKVLDLKFDVPNRPDRHEHSIVKTVLQDGRAAVLERNCLMKCRMVVFQHQVIDSSPDDWFGGFEEGMRFNHRTRIDENGRLQVCDIFLET